jgi:hypothetical protein
VSAWIGDRIGDPALHDAYLEVADLASWSDWQPLEEALPWAPRDPGVYLFREPGTQRIVHVGMAGERAGGGRPQGLYGRLSDFRGGHSSVGGFTEAALDRALADRAWVAQQSSRAPRRTRQWGADAVRRLAPEVSWAARPERADARLLQDQVLLVLRPHGLWA